jgi:hypothetical protein
MTREELADQFAAILPRIPQRHHARPAMQSWHDGLTQDRVPLTADYLADAQCNLEWMESALERIGK